MNLHMRRLKHGVWLCTSRYTPSWITVNPLGRLVTCNGINFNWIVSRFRILLFENVLVAKHRGTAHSNLTRTIHIHVTSHWTRDLQSTRVDRSQLTWPFTMPNGIAAFPVFEKITLREHVNILVLRTHLSYCFVSSIRSIIRRNSFKITIRYITQRFRSLHLPYRNTLPNTITSKQISFRTLFTFELSSHLWTMHFSLTRW